MPPDTNEQIDAHYNTVVKAIIDGRIVPFLGAGANLCDRQPDKAWQRGQQLLPSGSELSEYLANEMGYPEKDKKSDLVRVSQYISTITGSGPLYEKLRSVFDTDFPPTTLHRFFAALPFTLREKGLLQNYQLIVTTNYDDLMEKAFRDAREPFDLVTYIAEGENKGKFLHWLSDGEVRVIERPNEYREISLDKRTVILKIHGTIDRSCVDRDSFVITEDHYIDYLTRTDISNLVPVMLAAKLRKSHFLFLGYSLYDWNLRVILHRIWGEQKLNYKSWAIQLNSQELEKKIWSDRHVEILEIRLNDYINALTLKIKALPQQEKAS